MFKSFFPNPKWFFLSALAWIAIALTGWYTVAGGIGAALGFTPVDPEADPVLGLGYFV
ncbi:MAG: Peptide antibiotic transporter SbmA, partial [Pseudomonadota bacterium]